MQVKYARHCIGCNARHYRFYWYGSDYSVKGKDGDYWCEQCHEKIDESPGSVQHPSWDLMIRHVYAKDHTGARIVAAKYRCDIQ